MTWFMLYLCLMFCVGDYIRQDMHGFGMYFAALVSSGGNSRLSLAALNNRDFVVRTGHFVSLLSVIGGWGGVLPPHFGQKKSRRPFSDFLLGVPLCGRRVFNCKSSGQVDCAFPSEKISLIYPLLLQAESSRVIRCAKTIGIGISCAVSSHA